MTVRRDRPRESESARWTRRAFTQTTEAAARTGADRRSRFRVARAEAGEAAGILEGLVDLGVVSAARADEVLELLWRLSAMLCKLARIAH